MSSVSSFISTQLRSKNAADSKRTPLLSAILQEYALRRVFYQKKRAFSCNSLVATASEKLPRIYFQEASLPKAVSGQRTKVAVCLTSTMHSAPMGTSVPAVTPRTPPNRRLRQLQRTARTRTHRKCETRSSHTCAGCLRRRSDCSWRRRSPASSAAAAAVKMMIRTRHLHCLRIVLLLHRAHAARAQIIERNSDWRSSTWFNSAQLNLVLLYSTQLNSTGLDFTSQLHLELHIN